MKKELINDDRLTPDTKRMRSGQVQSFTLPDGTKFDLKHDQREMYADLIDDKWYWVSGCAECNGKPRDGFAYIGECDKHNVCRECGIHRSEITETPWGGSEGWCCVPCADRIDSIHKAECLAKVAEKEYDEWNYMHTDNIICPHCENEVMVDEDPNDYQGTSDCEVCGGEYNVEVEFSVNYTTKVVGERIK